MSDVVSIKRGRYSTPVGELIVDTDSSGTKLTVSVKGFTGDVSWRFNSGGIFSTIEVDTKDVSAPVTTSPLGGTIIVCKHITPEYTGKVHARKLPNNSPIIVCPECSTIDLSDNTSVRILDKEIWENMVSPCVSMEPINKGDSNEKVDPVY